MKIELNDEAIKAVQALHDFAATIIAEARKATPPLPLAPASAYKEALARVNADWKRTDFYIDETDAGPSPEPRDYGAGSTEPEPAPSKAREWRERAESAAYRWAIGYGQGAFDSAERERQAKALFDEAVAAWEAAERDLVTLVDMRARWNELVAERDAAVRERDEARAEKTRELQINRALRDRPDMGDRAKRVNELIAERDAAVRELKTFRATETEELITLRAKLAAAEAAKHEHAVACMREIISMPLMDIDPRIAREDAAAKAARGTP